MLSSRVNVENPLANMHHQNQGLCNTWLYKHYQRVGNNNLHSCDHYGHTCLLKQFLFQIYMVMTAYVKYKVKKSPVNWLFKSYFYLRI